MLELMELLHKVDEQGIDDKLHEKPMAIEKHQGHSIMQKRDTMSVASMKMDFDDIILDSHDLEVEQERVKLEEATLFNIKQSLSTKM